MVDDNIIERADELQSLLFSFTSKYRPQLPPEVDEAIEAIRIYLIAKVDGMDWEEVKRELNLFQDGPIIDLRSPQQVLSDSMWEDMGVARS